MDQTLKLLKEITDAPGVPGFEHEVRKVIRSYMDGQAEITTDRIGSIICKKVGNTEGPRIMIAGHMDEVGFMVSKVTKEGFVKFQTLGGWWSQVMLGQKVTIKTRKGDITGILGSKPPHILTPEERSKVVNIDDMFIDVCAADETEAKEVFGIRPGDPIVPDATFTVMKNEKFLMAKAWDDRLGCALFIEVIKALQNVEHANTVFGVGTVQEEVGLRGATTSSFVVNPDIGFALEVGIAGDTPGAEKMTEKLGKGPALLMYDASMIPHVKLRDFVIDVAAEVGIPLQFDVMPGGGTDAGRIHVTGRGVPSLVIAVPTRYIHSHYGIIHRDDYEHAVKLVVELVKRLDNDKVAELNAD
ncbi:MAG: M42 family metallopeptidase [Firmicutes bacterium]|nr:M42 family metallopeptidase [Dethiobacter sp.]MBS3889368.1 M42 family metallopeptidase [Bacillota bacterium]MBS4055302.1 M42 family metallopeptidase [Thermaerobacter sp.]